MKKILIITYFLCLGLYVQAQTFPSNYKKEFKNASVLVSGDTLIMRTGKMERKWMRTDAGLLTTSVKDLVINKEWVKLNPDIACDWDLPGAITAKSKAVYPIACS